MKVIEFQPTPNPNALKLVLDGAISAQSLSFFKAEDAAGNPLAEALFAIPGVTGLLILNDFITINRSPDAKWADIKKAATKTLKSQSKK